MKNVTRNAVTGLALSATILISACGGSSGDSGGVSGSTENNAIVSNDFAFPDVSIADQGASIDIPGGQMPEFSARRTLSKGVGAPIEFGEPVVLSYNMYSWSTGELVESTDTLDEALTVRAGVGEGVPEYLSKSLLGRQVGDTLQLVFKQGMEDLPEYLDDTDAYVLVVSVL